MHTSRNFFKKYLWRCISSNSLTLEGIHCYGSLLIRCPSTPVHIKSINPHDVPDGNKSFISMKSSKDNFNLENFAIDYNKDDSLITIMAKNENRKFISDDILHVQVPHIYNIDIEALYINIEETEGDVLKLKSEYDCNLGKIKTHKTDIESNGSLSCEHFFGDGYLKILQDVSVKKIQSTNIVIDANSIDISAVYCPDFKCDTITGKINIENLHGIANISSKSGSISIGTLDGNLNVQTESGNVDITIERSKETSVISESGDINIGLGDNISAFIVAKGKHIDVPEDLLVDGMKEHSSTGNQSFEGRYGDGSSSIETTTNVGSIFFSRKNWFSKFQVID